MNRFSFPPVYEKGMGHICSCTVRYSPDQGAPSARRDDAANCVGASLEVIAGASLSPVITRKRRQPSDPDGVHGR
jgi:hypothetical protein